MKNKTLIIFAAVAFAIGAFVVIVDSSRADIGIECNKYGTCFVKWGGKTFAEYWGNSSWEVTNQKVYEEAKQAISGGKE